MLNARQAFSILTVHIISPFTYRVMSRKTQQSMRQSLGNPFPHLPLIESQSVNSSSHDCEMQFERVESDNEIRSETEGCVPNSDEAKCQEISQ